MPSFHLVHLPLRIQDQRLKVIEFLAIHIDLFQTINEYLS